MLGTRWPKYPFSRCRQWAGAPALSSVKPQFDLASGYLLDDARTHQCMLHVRNVLEFQSAIIYKCCSKTYFVVTRKTKYLKSFEFEHAWLGCAYMSTQEGGASHNGFGELVSTTLPLFQDRQFVHDLPHPSWVHIKVHLHAS